MTDMSQDKHLAVWEWLYKNEQISRLYYNFSDSGMDNTVLITLGDNRIRRYIDGSEMRQYDFSIAQYKEMNATEPNSDENVSVMIDAGKVMQWIEEQEKLHNYPNFPDGCIITKVEPLQAMPSVAGMDEMEAKYLFSCRITYYQSV